MAYESRLRDYFIRRLLEEIPGSSINGDRRNRLPNNVNISIAGVNGPAVVALLDLEGICVSSASACSTGEQKASHVQLAIGNAGHQAYEAIRFTLGIQNTPEELDDTVEVLKRPNLTCVHEQVAKVDCECPLYFKPEEIPVFFS